MHLCVAKCINVFKGKSWDIITKVLKVNNRLPTLRLLIENDFTRLQLLNFSDHSSDGSKFMKWGANEPPTFKYRSS